MKKADSFNTKENKHVTKPFSYAEKKTVKRLFDGKLYYQLAGYSNLLTEKPKSTINKKTMLDFPQSFFSLFISSCRKLALLVRDYF